MEPNPNQPPSNSPQWTLTYQDIVYAVMAVQAVTGQRALLVHLCTVLCVDSINPEFNITREHINWALQLDSHTANGAPETLNRTWL